jgi:signal peptidase I
MTTLDLLEKAERPATPVGTAARRHTVSVVATDVQLLPRRRAGAWWRRSAGRLMVLALIAMTVRVFVGEASVVPTGSMEGTILVGDHLFMDKLLYGPEIPVVHWRLPRVKSIHRGDIIVFRYPRNPAETYLKRVAALGGDTLEIRNGVVYVNSRPAVEPYVVHNLPAYARHEQMAARIIPPGKLFVMGDNRDNSSDSREWGLVPEKNVLGEPMLVYWSYDAPTARWLDETPSHRVAFYASIAENFFSRTRWNRMGTWL